MSLGGGQNSSKSSSSEQSGFRDLPAEIQNVFKQLATNAGSYLPSNNPDAANMFKPIGQTDAETQALGNINKGFTPNAQQYQSDIAMQMNPFDTSVIDGINRQGQGQNSILQQNLNSAGQFGSNRAALGANDIDLSRLQQIGQFKQGQFNTASQNALSLLPQMRANDANAQLQGGSFQRQLGLQQAQAPISLMSAISQILGVLPTNSGQSQSTSKSSGWNANISGNYSQ